MGAASDSQTTQANRGVRAWFTRDRVILVALLGSTLLVRAGVLWLMRGNLNQDPDAYREIAENLLVHGEFALGKPVSTASEPVPTAYRPPLYPVVLSNLPTADGQQVSLLKVALLHLALGVATVWLTWLAAQMVGRSRRERLAPQDADLFPALAALLVACDPILLNQQTLVMTETLATFLAILSLWCLARFDNSSSWFNAALAGGAIGLAILCRPTFLPWLGLVVATMLLLRVRKSEVRSQNAESDRLFRFDTIAWQVVNVVALLVIAAAVVSPWAIRNYRLFGKPIVTTTHGGYTLYLGNNESFYRYLRNGERSLPWNASSMEPQIFSTNQPLSEEKIQILKLLEKEASALGVADNLYSSSQKELVDNRVEYALAKQCIRNHPADFLHACVYRIGQLWSPLPHKLTADESTSRRLLRYGTWAWYCGIYALAIVGVWRLRSKLFRPPWIWGLLLCLTFTAVHTFYWTNLRMRVPLMPFVALVAAAGVADSARGWRIRQGDGGNG